MRAMVVENFGGPTATVLQDVPEPAGAHPRACGRRVLVEVHAVGLSFIDPLQTRGLYQAGVAAPYICGSELAGLVLEAPADSWVNPGDRVAGIVWQGAMAERALAIDDFMVRLPDSMSYATGAGVYMNYATAWYALDRAGCRPGEHVLVTGAAGGVGTCVLDLGPAFGVSTIALVSSDAKAATARAARATHVVRTDEDWQGEIRRLTDHRGVEVFVDMVGGETFLDTVRALRVGGRGVVVGFAGGSIPEIRVNRLLLRNLTLTGITMDVMETEYPGTLTRVRTGVQRLLDAGEITPSIGSTYPLERAVDALRSLEDRTAVGKVVVQVR
ncbi:NADPH:quinone reductase [Parafrankia irregularis]|uniref:NADPH:quinone reductase n=1 Tax=Parafrankia irregularis TaxID=795642 RepID=A0A0S4QNQ3_9ACTN|nr:MULTISPECIES: NADPH:quinone oxidoreductase family protein [Parafrankia]MBE3200264.1 NADPH:quinone oxidoreductase family protein [Parafrankia sp. CH37]CUU56536.1 NADPH:quinone reductase [Parafrankia irregularis]